MHNTVEHLVTMANQIGQFFSTMHDRAQALDDIASHLCRFWEPRMRRALLAHVEQHAGAGLSEIVLESLRTHSRRVAGATVDIEQPLG